MAGETQRIFGEVAFPFSKAAGFVGFGDPVTTQQHIIEYLAANRGAAPNTRLDGNAASLLTANLSEEQPWQ